MRERSELHCIFLITLPLEPLFIPQQIRHECLKALDIGLQARLLVVLNPMLRTILFPVRAIPRIDLAQQLRHSRHP